MKKYIGVIILLIVIAGNLYLIAPLLVDDLRSDFGSCLGYGSEPDIPAFEPAEGLEALEPIVVALDPGHGGSDPGADNAALGLAEDEINLSIAEALRDELEATGYFEVCMTRGKMSEGESMDLAERVAIAKQAGAQIFLALHCNATFEDYSGAELYRSAYDDGDAERLAHALMRGFGRIGMRRRGIFTRLSQTADADSGGVPNDYYGVVRMAQLEGIPSLLVEHGFLNDIDRDFLDSKRAVRTIAKAEARAIYEYFGLVTLEPPVTGGGDADGDGAVTADDLAQAVAAVMCQPDAVSGAAYDALDIDGDALIDAADIAVVKLLAQNGVSGGMGVTIRQDTSADWFLSLEAESAPVGGAMGVNLWLGEQYGCATAVGTLDFKTSALRFDGFAQVPDGLTWTYDDKFGLVRYCYCAPAGAESAPLALSALFTVISGADEALSVNSNIYGCVAIGSDGALCERGGVVSAAFNVEQ